MKIKYPHDIQAFIHQKEKSGVLYRDFLADASATYEAPIHTPIRSIAKTISVDEYATLSDWIARWQQFLTKWPSSVTKDRRKIGTFGTFDLPARIVFSVRDAVQWANLEQPALRFTQAIQMAREEAPFWEGWVSENAYEVCKAKNFSNLPSLLAVGKWLQEQDGLPQDANSLRELAIPGLDTKFLEHNMRAVSSLFQFLTGARRANKADVLDAIGVESYPQDGDFVKIRMPDPACRLGALSLVSVPNFELSNLGLHPSCVFIVENKATFYHFPAVRNSLILFGSGYAATGHLINIPFLHETPDVYYWSDLDKDGFSMLSHLRQSYPTLHALFMDLPAMRAGFRFAVPDTGSKAVSPTRLNQSEKEAFALLSQKRLRIEQERFPMDAVRAYLQNILHLTLL